MVGLGPTGPVVDTLLVVLEVAAAGLNGHGNKLHHLRVLQQCLVLRVARAGTRSRWHCGAPSWSDHSRPGGPCGDAAVGGDPPQGTEVDAARGGSSICG